MSIAYRATVAHLHYACRAAKSPRHWALAVVLHLFGLQLVARCANPSVEVASAKSINVFPRIVRRGPHASLTPLHNFVTLYFKIFPFSHTPTIPRFSLYRCLIFTKGSPSHFALYVAALHFGRIPCARPGRLALGSCTRSAYGAVIRSTHHRRASTAAAG